MSLDTLPDQETLILEFVKELEDQAVPCQGVAGTICDNPATWAARFDFTCGHENMFLLCDQHIKFYQERLDAEFECYMCKCFGRHTPGKLRAIWKI